MSIFDDVDAQTLELLLTTSNSVSELLRSIGLSPIGGNYKTLRVKSENFGLGDLYSSLITKGRRTAVDFALKSNKTIMEMYTKEEVFCENSKVNRETVKKWILKEKLIPYKCRDCGNEGFWNGKSITLQIEHIDGVNNNHSLDNLCFLCPNCHTQTPSYGGKNTKLSKERRTSKIESILRTKEKIDSRVERRKNVIIESGIDLTKRGWSVKVGNLLGITSQKAAKWVNDNMQD